MDDTVLNLLKDTPTLLLVVIVGRWLAVRIDRVLDLHERLIQRCFEEDRFVPTGKPWIEDEQR